MRSRELFEVQMMMFLLMGVGALLRRKNILTEEGKKMLSDLVMDVSLPCSIVSSFCIEFSRETLKAGMEILIVSVVLQIFCALIGAFCYNRVPKRQRTILRYGTVCSSGGLLGSPIAEELFGAQGLLYSSIYLIPQRIVMWSAGVSYFTEAPSKKELVKKIITHPCIVAVGIGMVLMITQIQLPGVISRSLDSLGDCNTALTMMMIGAILAEAGFHNMVNKVTVGFSVIRLLLIPLGVMVGCLLFHVEAMAAELSVVLAAMPAGATTAILAAKYDGDEVFATQCVVLTTILSMVLLPVWCMVLERVF